MRCFSGSREKSRTSAAAGAFQGQNVPAPALHDGRCGAQVVQEALKLRLNLLAAAAPGAGTGLAGELEEIAALVVVQMQYPGEDVQDGCGRLHTALFEPGVVVGADAGELGDLLAAQPGHSAWPAGLGEPDRAGAQLRAALLEEFSQLVEGDVAGHAAQHGTDRA